MHLVTGAAGKTGRAVISALVARSVPVRALVRHSTQRDAVEALGADDVRIGDLRDGPTLSTAMKGIESAYLICPNVHPAELEMVETAIGAAQSADLSRLVYHSVLHPQTNAMPHHWQKLLAEERLLEAPLSVTVLQPAPYQQNLLAVWPDAEAGTYPVPYSPAARFSWVDLEDVSEVAARVLTESGHEDAIYELAGPAALDADGVASAWAAALGRPVGVERIDVDEWARDARLTGYARHALMAMFKYYDRNGLVGNPNVLKWLIGREPGGVEAFLTREAARRVAR